MSGNDWIQGAACGDLWPVFDLDYYATLRVAPPSRLPQRWREMSETFQQPSDAAAVCATCPVMEACRRDADARWAEGEPMSCVAGGELYHWKPFGKSSRGAA